MEQVEFLKIMRLTDLFRSFSDDELLDLKKIAIIKEVPENKILIKQWEYGNTFYIILRGHVEVFVTNNDGKEKVISRLGQGEYFGELAILVDSIRAASVRTIKNCIFLSLEKDAFGGYLDAHPSLCRSLLQIMSERLAKTLHVFSERNKKTFIRMIYNDESIDRVTYFENYFTKISPVKTIKINKDNIEENLPLYSEKNDNYYFLIRDHVGSEKKLIHKADYVVNFVENNQKDFYLSPASTLWTIENVARKITKKTVGIALASGGAPAMAHMGVLTELKKENIPIDFVVGTSAGSLYGAMFAFGHSYDAFLKILQREISKPKLVHILLNMSFKFSGLMRHTHLKALFYPIFGDSKIEDALIPFAAVASDLLSGKTIVLNHGSTIQALVASSAAPLLIEPVKYGNYLLIDGVATAPLPVSVLYEEKIDIKIAVDIAQLDLIVSIGNNPKLTSIYLRSRSMMAHEIATYTSKLADIVIQPKIEKSRLIDWRNMDKYIEAGRQAAIPAIKSIRQYLKSPWHHE